MNETTANRTIFLVDILIINGTKNSKIDTVWIVQHKAESIKYVLNFFLSTHSIIIPINIEMTIPSLIAEKKYVKYIVGYTNSKDIDAFEL